MMKWLPILLLCLSGVHGDAPRDFAWRIPLSGDPEARAYYRIPLPREVRAKAMHFPRDLRIFDENGNNWAFFQERSVQEGTTPETVPAQTRNQLLVEGPGGYRQVDLHLSGDRPVHTRVHIQTDGSDFVRRVEILGSDDQETWGLMAMGYLIHANRPQTLRETTIRYPASMSFCAMTNPPPGARRAAATFSVWKASYRSTSG